jgi:hypothetical protein
VFVCLSVCLSVSVSARHLYNCSTDFDKILSIFGYLARSCVATCPSINVGNTKFSLRIVYFGINFAFLAFVSSVSDISVLAF